MATLDWLAIENEYVTGSVSYGDLAIAHGVSKKQVARYGRANDWVAKRQEFRSRTSTEGLQKAEAEASEASALVFRIGRLILERFLVALEEGGIRLTPADAEKWGKLLLEMERAGRETTLGVVFGADLLAQAAVELRRWRVGDEAA
ncbi:MAG: hypothetical protein FJ014_13225 [Chloroflexi bacterium]|nr:hypothetical protein [Chloroflexota bacterium]